VGLNTQTCISIKYIAFLPLLHTCDRFILMSFTKMMSQATGF